MVNIYNFNGHEMVQDIKDKETLVERELSTLANLMADGLEEIAPKLDKYLLPLIDLADLCYEEYKEGKGFVDDPSNMWYYSLTSRGDVWCQWQEMHGSRSDHYIITEDVHGFLNHLITSSDSAEKYIKKVIRSVEELNKEHNLKIELPKIFSSYKEVRQKLEVQA